MDMIACERFGARFRRAALIWPGLLAALVLLALPGCGGKSTPPGANVIYGSVGDGHYSFLWWQEGLRLMIWDDVDGNHGYSGSGSTEDPVYRGAGAVEAADGGGYTYELETTDGQTASFTLAGDVYDLANGVLFLVTSQEGSIRVAQLQRDFSALETTNAAVEALAASDADIAAFVAEAGGGR
jgi:hypothetical protein